MRTDDLDFSLPPDLIAQTPSADRAAARLLHYRRSDRSVAHLTFSDLPALLRPDDVVVFNDARVLPARFLLRKGTGGAVEGLFLCEVRPGRWRVLLRNLGRATDTLTFDREPTLSAAPTRQGDEFEIELSSAEPAAGVLARLGRMPLPPYIRRERGADPRDDADRSDYQTVYARAPGSVAAPTAGLHFTPALLAAIDALGVQRVAVTLHVGMGTFKPVTADDLADHAMHTEAYEVDGAAADALNGAERDGRRIVAIGTTAARVLESWAAGEPWRAATGSTDIFIRPPYRWRRVGALVTNFHLPRSTLVALVAAFVGLEEQRRLYAEAVAERYRFFSYGDAMFLE
jgi:S-adenosylmethionine:tRNA ribosyltransferase-isomerase